MPTFTASEEHPSGVFCNRTLNLRGVAAIGYDMDYTLVTYDVQRWEQRSFDHLRALLADEGWPVDDVRFDSDFVIRGLVIDRRLGNIVKANRFGYVKQAAHGCRMMDFDETRRTYSRTIVDLADDRWVFLNTLFAVSEASMYAHLVDCLDARRLPDVMGYADLHDRVSAALDQAHIEGNLKAEIVADPAATVELDPRIALALLDQRAAGKRLLLITNSDFPYTRAMMSYAFDRFMPAGTSWVTLFELVIVSARKPAFFDTSSPVFRVTDDGSCLRPEPMGLTGPGVYYGGDAGLVERYMGLDSSDFLYVGDHIFADVHVSKRARRWRTALVLRELRDEMCAIRGFAPEQRQLTGLMATKEDLERTAARSRLAQLRRRHRHAPPPEGSDELPDPVEMRARLERLDAEIGPLARAATELGNRRWGPVMRAGNDKSMLARQMESYADVYCSSVADFVDPTPYAYFRSARGSLPHDPTAPGVETETP